MMLIHSNNRAEAIHRLQQQRARNFDSLIKEDPEKAWQVAMSNLQSAGILDECGGLWRFTLMTLGLSPRWHLRAPYRPTVIIGLIGNCESLRKNDVFAIIHTQLVRY